MCACVRVYYQLPCSPWPLHLLKPILTRAHFLRKVGRECRATGRVGGRAGGVTRVGNFRRAVLWAQRARRARNNEHPSTDEPRTRLTTVDTPWKGTNIGTTATTRTHYGRNIACLSYVGAFGGTVPSLHRRKPRFFLFALGVLFFYFAFRPSQARWRE